jgi:integrase/recombinase XerD
MTKNRKIATVPLVPRVRRAIYLYIGERTDGPVFLGAEGRRLDRSVAYRRMRRLAQLAGVDKRIGNHSMRRSFITNALDAGVPMRDVQHSVHHKDARTTGRYDQHRRSLDTHAGYALSAFIPGS